MKNHVRVNGQLLQTNKKWSHLKNSQRQWIQETTAKEHAAYVSEHDRLPMKKRKEDVLDRVHDCVIERGIWIPYREFRSHVSVMIDRLNHKSPLFVPPAKKVVPEKPKTSKAAFEDFPAEVQDEMKSTITRGVESYVWQAHRIPPNKIRDSAIKQLLRGFNAKHWKAYGMQMQSSDTLQAVYDEIRKDVYATISETRFLPKKLSASKLNELREQTIVLETDRLILRKIRGHDYKEIREMLADPDVMLAWERVYTTKKEIMEWIVPQLRRYEKDFVGYFAAVDKVSGQIVGLIGLMWNVIQGKRCLEAGYIIKKTHWGKGYATEGAEACIAYGFALFGVEKVYATIRPENTASIAVAERIGMKPEGECIKTLSGKRIRHLIYVRENQQ